MAKLTDAQEQHHGEEAGAVQRAVRRQERGEDLRLVSLSDRPRSISLPVLIVPQYIPIMAKITRKPAPRKASVPKKKAKASRCEAEGSRQEIAEAARRQSTKPWTPAEVHEVFSRFRKANPEPKGELEHVNPFTLLVAVVLSAQATDAGVNKATRALFEIADTPQKMLDLGEERLREYIKTIGLYRTKARNVIALSAKVLSEFGGEVPRTRAGIESLPGAGRKTANVVLNMAFGEHTMAVDTHVFRVGNRTGTCARQDAARSRARSRKGDPGRIHAARPSLADPARPLYLPRAQAALRGMPDQRSLPVAGEDGLRMAPCSGHAKSWFWGHVVSQQESHASYRHRRLPHRLRRRSRRSGRRARSGAGSRSRCSP